MKENDTILRPETRDDHRKTENLTREAFWNVCRPGFLDGVSGTCRDPEGYFACERDPEGFAAFEAAFPPKEKRKLPGQLF